MLTELLLVARFFANPVHIHNLHGGYFNLRALVDLSRRYPVFLTLHDEWLDGYLHPDEKYRPAQRAGGSPSAGPWVRARRQVVRCVNRFRRSSILRRCQLHVSAPSRWLLDRVRLAPWSRAIRSSRVIPNGIDLERFQPGDRGAARAALKLPTQDIILLFVANGTRNNGFKDYALIRSALQRLTHDVGARRILFLAVGEAGDSAECGCVRIVHLPRLPHAELPRYYQAADIYIHAAKTESFGLTIVEALACGISVVATSVGAVPEVTRRDCATLTPPDDAGALADALVRMISNREAREEMGRRGAAYARERFDERRMVADYQRWFAEAYKHS